MITIRIGFNDISTEMQNKILAVFGDNNNWDVVPMTVMEINDDREIVLDSWEGDKNVPAITPQDSCESAFAIHTGKGKETVRITREGRDDYSVYFTQQDCSVRGTLQDIIQEITKSNDYDMVKEIQALLWENDDLMDQDTLFALQKKVSEYALTIAEREGKCDDLVKTFPWLYETNSGEEE